MIRTLVSLAGLIAVAGGCTTVPDLRGTVAPDADASEIVVEADGSCSGRETIPAVIETVTEQIMISPAVLNPDGSIRQAALFETVTRQQIVEERRELSFEAVCPEVLTPEFIASLQRALQVRNGYSGPITGQFDPVTQQALRRWQVARGGPNSDVLALATARELGLAALSRDRLDE